MSTEREQLELAAKACGLIPTEFEGNDDFMFGVLSWFKPHLDDGDCARMEAQLGLSILWFKDYVLSGKGRLHQVIDCNGDKNAARRAASVAVAAEIGKLM